MSELTPNNVQQERDLSSLSGTILLFSVISNGGYILNDFEFIVCLGPRAIFRSSSQNYSSFMLPDSVRLNAFSVLADNDRRKEGGTEHRKRERETVGERLEEGGQVCSCALCTPHAHMWPHTTHFRTQVVAQERDHINDVAFHKC